MNAERKCMIGNDYDDGDYGCMFAAAIAMVIVMFVIMITIYGGIFIGGYHSIKNYILAFRHNVIDSNRKTIPAAN